MLLLLFLHVYLNLSTSTFLTSHATPRLLYPSFLSFFSTLPTLFFTSPFSLLTLIFPSPSSLLTLFSITSRVPIASFGGTREVDRNSFSPIDVVDYMKEYTHEMLKFTPPQGFIGIGSLDENWGWLR